MEKPKREGSSVKERLIQAGIEEICENGIRNFSTRRVAARCGVSCAAPYKHFADQQELIQAIIDHINQEWYRRQSIIEKKYEGDTRKQLVEISRAYIYFLVEYPSFRSTIMIRDNEEEPEHIRARAGLSECTKRLVAKYCQEVGMSPEDERRKTYVVRSLIYGAALMVDNGELPDVEESHRAIAETIEREFDLP